MLLAVDVHYADPGATAAGVLFHDWSDDAAARELVVPISHAEPYEPGAFYRRELPCIHEVLKQLTTEPSTIVVDGYVWLDAHGRKGLGAHLYDALGGRVAVVGVAKTTFRGSPHAERVLRGQSTKPLNVTAIGVPPATAACEVGRMHGAHRLPFLLKRVDQLCRGLVLPHPGSP